MYYFPLKNKKRIDKWLNNIKIKGFVPARYSRLCIKHFLLSHFSPYNNGNGNLRLNDYAIPLIFNSSNIKVHC